MGLGDRIKDALNDVKDSIQDMADGGTDSVNSGADAVQDRMNDAHSDIAGERLQGRTIEDQGVVDDLGDAARDRASEIEQGVGDARDGLGNKTSI